MIRTGLTLGKFAPLHKGHQYLIETALQEVDRLIILIYDVPKVTPVPLQVRAQWIRRLYPETEVIEVSGGPEEVGYTPEIMRAHEKFILGILKGRIITHFYSSERYGDHMSQALGAIKRTIDVNRENVPISATKIRQDYFSSREFLSPVVYNDHIANVVFLGAPSTGKTTIAEVLSKRFATAWMPEYGREYWEKHQVGRRLSPSQLVEIAEGHVAREEKLLFESNRFLFTDTNAITTYLFALHYHGSSPARVRELASHCRERYDLVFLCDIDIPYENTWDRSGEVNRQEFQQRTVSELKSRDIPYHLLSGDLSQRIAHVTDVVSNFSKFNKYPGR